MDRRDRPHILVTDGALPEAFRPHPRKVDAKPVPSPDSRRQHATMLQRAFRDAETAARARRDSLGITVAGAVPGLYVQFRSQPEVKLNLGSLEDKRQKIELVAVSETTTEDSQTIQLATVFVPEGKVRHFLNRFEKYATKDTPKGLPWHQDMVERISELRLATLQALWTDDEEDFPESGTTFWWEVWLRRHDGREYERMQEFARTIGARLGPRRLQFHDRIVVLVEATPERLSASIDVLNDIAEVRRSKETASFFDAMAVQEQVEWVSDLQRRSNLPGPDCPAVCILDTGTNAGHPLLQQLASPQDLHAVDQAWGVHDHDGHGTEMAGLAAYGDLTGPLSHSAPVQLSHRLESVKILPPVGRNQPDMYGSITADAASRAEVAAPNRRRVFSMAVTDKEGRERGKPTSWSAAVDALAAGRIFDSTSQGLVYLDQPGSEHRRLFLISAGNVDPISANHLDASDTDAVHDPGQSWNALTIGACTRLATLDPADQSRSGWGPLARAGELSPFSTTSVLFKDVWPIKPDVVFEGGNAVRYGETDRVDAPVPSLSVLTTYYQPQQRLLTIGWATSAATAQVAAIAGRIMAEYPEFWPETVRALLAHSARWTPLMRNALDAQGGRRDKRTLVRRYGLGVPDQERALRSARNSVTLIAQDTIHPFSDGKMGEMHLHRLPWPREVLESLGDQEVHLRVTLTYFIEPNPGRRGWKKRYSYASHQLRFDVKGPYEEVDDFRKRLNQQALDEDEKKPSSGSDSSGWYLGAETRNKGCLHSDIWTGTAAELAARGFIGIVPVTGWWKAQPKRDRSAYGARYSLIVSIEAPEVDVDVWTPVANLVGIPTVVET